MDVHLASLIGAHAGDCWMSSIALPSEFSLLPGATIEQIMSEDQPLAYISRSPQANSDHPAPAVVLIHGRGADERDLLSIATRLPDSMHFFAVRGPIDFEDGYAWYRLDVDQGGLHTSQPDSTSLSQSVTRIGTFLAYIAEQYQIDPTRIGLFGFSQGGTLALATAIEASKRVAWVVAMNAYLPQSHRSVDKLVDARSVPVFLAAGEVDLVIPEERTKRASTRLSDAGLSVTYRTYPTGHGAIDQELDDISDWITARL